MDFGCIMTQEPTSILIFLFLPQATPFPPLSLSREKFPFPPPLLTGHGARIGQATPFFLSPLGGLAHLLSGTFPLFFLPTAR